MACAGAGLRAGTDGPKQYAPLAGRGVVAHTLAALDAVPRLTATLVVLAPDDAAFEDAVPGWQGERRWRAAQIAGLTRVPIVVREVQSGQERSVLEMALIENIQRENLNPIDEALAYRRLADEFQLTQEQIAASVGKDRATVANFLRLLKLPDEVRSDVATGVLSMGHARALLALPNEADQRRVARDIVNRNLSVRETESIVRKASEAPATHVKSEKEAPKADVHTRAAEERLRILFGTRVHIVRKGAKGRIEIDFGSEDELIRLFEQLTGDR